MSRQALGDGRWFNTKTAKLWKEETRWNGNNHISLATGSQWNHEELYRTASGKWVLHCWSQWQGSVDSYREIDSEEAARWLSRNEHEPVEACAKEFAALEI